MIRSFKIVSRSLIETCPRRTPRIRVSICGGNRARVAATRSGAYGRVATAPIRPPVRSGSAAPTRARPLPRESKPRASHVVSPLIEALLALSNNRTWLTRRRILERHGFHSRRSLSTVSLTRVHPHRCPAAAEDADRSTRIETTARAAHRRCEPTLSESERQAPRRGRRA